MMNRLKVSVLLKSVITMLAVGMVAMLSLGVWDSWTRLATTKRIGKITEASAYLFTAIHNLRYDRVGTFRELTSDKQATAISPGLQAYRDKEIPALMAGLVVLELAEFPEQKDAVANLGQTIKSLTALQQESNAAFLLSLIHI